MLLDLLDRTLELPSKSKVVTQPYLDFLTHQYKLSHNGMHGIEHWLRVLINGRLITAQNGADIEVVEHFSLLHDVQRQDEYGDIQHGGRAADFAASLMGDWVHLNSTQMYQLSEACRYHSMGRLSKDVAIQTCWDADRLDLGRVGGMQASNWKWHLDEVFVKINGERHYLWRAVDHEGEVLESYVTKKRDKRPLYSS